MRAEYRPNRHNGHALAAKATVLLSLVLSLYASSAMAGGGFGAVWTTNTTANSITIQATDPASVDSYRDAASPPLIQICWKVKNAIQGACGTPSGVFPDEGNVVVNSLPYTLTSLSPDTAYKIKVLRFCEKKSWGKFRRPKFRKVGTLTTRTEASSPPVLGGHLAVAGVGDHSITVDLDVFGHGSLDLVRFAFKRRWFSAAQLMYTAGGRSRPDTTWFSNTKTRGWYDFTPGANHVAVMNNLRKCRSYRIVAYGFQPGQEEGILLGEVKAQTTGGCWLSFKNGVADDDQSVLEDYLASLSGAYPEGDLLQHLALAYDPTILDDEAALLADDEPMQSDIDVVDYLRFERPDIYERWQLECANRSDGQSLDDFARLNDATVWADHRLSADPIDLQSILEDGEPPALRAALGVDRPDVLVGEVGPHPLFVARAADLFHDSFPPSGVIDLVDKTKMATRIDAANTFGSSGAGWATGDSLVCTIVPPLGSTLSGTPSMTAALFANPTFDSARSVPVGFFPAGSDADGWTIYLGSVLGTPVNTASGVDSLLWSFDIPGDGPGRTLPGGGSESDEPNFFFAGDVIQYYLQAGDSNGGNATFPSNVGQVLVKNAHNACFTIRALPTIGAGGETPSMLIVNGTMAAGEWDRLGGNLAQNGLAVGVDFDLYTQQVRTADYRGSLAASGLHGATTDQLASYIIMNIGSSGQDGVRLVSNIGSSGLDGFHLTGDADSGGAWSDYTTLRDWFLLPGDRSILYLSDPVSNIGSSGLDGVAFTEEVLGADVTGVDLRTLLGTTTPSVAPNAVGFSQQLGLAQFCPRPTAICELSIEVPGPVASHVFRDASGNLLGGGTPAVTLWDRLVTGDRKVSMLVSYAPLALASDGSPNMGGAGMSASAVHLGEILVMAGMTLNGSPITDSGPTLLKPVLHQNRPNPFNPSTEIRFELPTEAPVTLRVYNIRGELVRTLLDGPVAAGPKRIVWTGRDDAGKRVGSGIYLYRLNALGIERSRKMVLLQ